LLQEFAARPPRADAHRHLELRFLRSPVAIHGTERVESLEVRPNKIVRTAEGLLTARPVDARTETIDCGLVLRSVGYRAVPLPEVPFDERYFVLPNDRGRVIGQDGRPVAGVYAVGWIKRGPTGILGTNKRDAQETIDCLVEDLHAGRLPTRTTVDPAKLDTLLADRKPNAVTTDGWRAIDTHERALGADQGRPRVKLATREQLLTTAGATE
jgi:ferredoxin--NADP+ reductase